MAPHSRLSTGSTKYATALSLPDLELDFNTADKLFEQIANVERPKEFGCEFGRGFDLIRWGFFYDNSRLQQLKEHGTVRRSTAGSKDPVDYSDIATDSELKSSFDTYLPGHEFLPIVQQLLNNNPNLKATLPTIARTTLLISVTTVGLCVQW